MKTKITPRFFLLLFALVGLLLLPGSIFAQQKTEEPGSAKKTITIHVTKEVNGNTITIDTTVVTEGDFDADAFLLEKGVMNDMPEGNGNMEREIVIRHPGSRETEMYHTEGNMPETLVINNDTIIMLTDVFEMPAPPPPMQGMPFDFNFTMPQEFSHMEGPQFEDMLEGLAHSFGLDDVMPFGEMKQVVVKKKRNGKKVIITFEDRDNENCKHGNRKEEKVIIYKNGDQGSAPQHEERVIIKGGPGEKVIFNEEVVKTAPAKQHKKVVVITEEKTK